MNDAFGLAQAQRGQMQLNSELAFKKRGNIEATEKPFGAFESDMQGVLCAGWRSKQRQRGKQKRAAHDSATGLISIAPLGRPAGVASNPALRRQLHLESNAKLSVQHLRVLGQQGHRTVFVGTQLGEVYALNEDPATVVKRKRAFHNHAACHLTELPDGVRCVVTCHSRSVTAVAAHPTAGHIFFTVGSDRRLLVWNMRNGTCAMSKRLPALATCIDISNRRLSSIAIGFELKGDVRVYLLETMAEVAHIKSCSEPISCIKFSPDGMLLAAGNRANIIDIYNVNRGYRFHRRLRGHTSFVECLDWSIDSKCLQSTCGSYEILYWDAIGGRQILDAETIETDTEWNSWSCKLGFPIMGIWGKNQSGNNVNAVCRSSSETLVATANDDGSVRIFNYPCVVNGAPFVGCRAHGTRVVGITFLSDYDRHLVSIGGLDKSIMVWKISSPPEVLSGESQSRQHGRKHVALS